MVQTEDVQLPMSVAQRQLTTSRIAKAVLNFQDKLLDADANTGSLCQVVWLLLVLLHPWKIAGKLSLSKACCCNRYRQRCMLCRQKEKPYPTIHRQCLEVLIACRSSQAELKETYKTADVVDHAGAAHASANRAAPKGVACLHHRSGSQRCVMARLSFAQK